MPTGNMLTTKVDVLAEIIALGGAVTFRFIDDQRDVEGRLNPDTISFRPSDYAVNQFVADWEAIRHNFFKDLMVSYEDYSEKALLDFQSKSDYKEAVEKLLMKKVSMKSLNIENVGDGILVKDSD